MKTNWKQPNIPRQITAKFEWKKEYASVVHEGLHLSDGSRGIARPWTEVTLSQVEPSLLMKAAYQGDLVAAFLLMVERLHLEFDEVIDHHDWGVTGETTKRYRGTPTWEKITDSGELRDSLEVTVDVQR